ncbi:outer membrane beta-barrel protein [Tenacibaculum crassostreae]|uniref:outer membrane beta-barrel protein n=1 Tax=Tenacibaculum crassostreae TaxID=502683 RepID=UPI003894B2A1
MKKLLLTIAMVVAGFTANAQEKGGFEKQDWFISGSAGFNSVSQEGGSDLTTFTFSPSVGYFVSENIALELALIIGSSTTETMGFQADIDQTGASLSGNYFFTPENNFSFTLGAGLSYTSVTTDMDGFGEFDSNVFSIAVAPGINYFISENFALRASLAALSYSNESIDVDGAPSTNSFGLNLNLSDINFGLTYKF